MTTGYRAGGFNLGYFSFIPTYDPEDLIAYELGYKGQMFDGTVQLNTSMYLYEYDDIHPQFDTFSFTGVSTSVQNAPSARTIGGELEGLWLVTDNLTVGVNYSFTDAEYNEELVEPVTGTRGVVDGSNTMTLASFFMVASATCRLTTRRCRGCRGARRPAVGVVRPELEPPGQSCLPDQYCPDGRVSRRWPRPVTGDPRAIMPSANLGCAGKDKAQQGRNEREGAYDE